MAPLTRFTLKAALALAIVAALIAPLPASAQTLYGSITGTVTDQQGAPIPGATVTATNTAPLAADDVYATDEDVPLVVPAGSGVLANDSDADGKSNIDELKAGANPGAK